MNPPVGGPERGQSVITRGQRYASAASSPRPQPPRRMTQTVWVLPPRSALVSVANEHGFDARDRILGSRNDRPGGVCWKSATQELSMSILLGIRESDRIQGPRPAGCAWKISRNSRRAQRVAISARLSNEACPSGPSTRTTDLIASVSSSTPPRTRRPEMSLASWTEGMEAQHRPPGRHQAPQGERSLSKITPAHDTVRRSRVHLIPERSILKHLIFINHVLFV